MTDVEEHRSESPTVGRWDRSTVPLLASTFCSSAGALALVTALGKQVFDLTGREIDLGLLGLAEFAPAALLVLLTGALADRHDRRRLGAIGSLIEAVGALLLILYISTDPTAVGPIFGVAVVYGAGRAFAAPAVRALPADVVTPARLPWLVARWSAVFQLAFVVGPVLGGMLYVVGPRAPYVAATVLFLASSVLILVVRVPPRVVRELQAAEVTGEAPTARERLHDAMEGLRFVRRQPILLGAISLDLFAVLFGGAVALLPAIAEDRLGVGAVGFGWLRAAVGIGAGAVTLFLARRPITRRVGRTLLIAVAVFGIGTIVLGLDDAATSSPSVALLVPRRRRRAERVHPLDPRAAGDAADDARAGARGGDRVHRGLERARRLRVRRRRAAARSRGGRGAGWGGHDRHRRAVVDAVPGAAPGGPLPAGPGGGRGSALAARRRRDVDLGRGGVGRAAGPSYLMGLELFRVRRVPWAAWTG